MLFWWTVVRGFLWFAFKMLYRARFEGAEHIPSKGPAIYVANHQSHMDPCTVGVLVGDRPFSGLARSTLFDNRLLGWMMYGIGVIPLNQSRGDTGAIKAALAALAAGRCVLIYPEGTRTRDGSVHEFKGGATLLIRRSGVRVVPIAMEGAFDIWPIGSARPHLTGRLIVQAAAPIAAEDLLRDGPDAAMRRLHAQIDGMRLVLRARLRRESGGRFPAVGPGDGPSSM